MASCGQLKFFLHKAKGMLEEIYVNLAKYFDFKWFFIALNLKLFKAKQEVYLSTSFGGLLLSMVVS